VTQNGCCLYCKCSFLRSPYRPQQAVCSRPECQRRRRADYHRRKLEADPEYRQIAHDSQKKWREAHPDYLPRYRAQHPEAVERNKKGYLLRVERPHPVGVSCLGNRWRIL
jgi:hypothetical protein